MTNDIPTATTKELDSLVEYCNRRQSEDLEDPFDVIMDLVCHEYNDPATEFDCMGQTKAIYEAIKSRLNQQ